jgi:HPt (histidine-containing phosphotransfer) domain-containing protein
MSNTLCTDDLLYSPLAEDRDLGGIVEMFVEEMPDRVSGLMERLNASDWEGLRRAAHQLRGAAGSYGFDPITRSAARLEEAIRQSEPEEEVRRSVHELADMCRRARAGTPN